MFYKSYLIIFFLILLNSCAIEDLNKKNFNHVQNKNFINKGFAIIYNEKLYKQKIVSNKIDNRSFTIFQKNLKANSQVKITNLLNNKTLLATVGKSAEYPSFNNSVITKRIANELDIDLNEPYLEIMAITKNSLFIAKKAKTFDEEKKVANKVPINIINISDLNETEEITKRKSNKKFSYLIKIADFYFKDTASLMVDRIAQETIIKNAMINKISNKLFRVYLGPFDNINSLQKSYNDINILEFENIEIIRND